MARRAAVGRLVVLVVLRRPLVAVVALPERCGQQFARPAAAARLAEEAIGDAVTRRGVTRPTIVSVPSICTNSSKSSIGEMRWTLKYGSIECFSFSAYWLPVRLKMRAKTGPVICADRS